MRLIPKKKFGCGSWGSGSICQASQHHQKFQCSANKLCRLLGSSDSIKKHQYRDGLAQSRATTGDYQWLKTIDKRKTEAIKIVERQDGIACDDVHLLPRDPDNRNAADPQSLTESIDDAQSEFRGSSSVIVCLYFERR